jgi:hypothetical protein
MIESYATKNMREMGLGPDKCAYCDQHINKITATLDHIIPLSQSGAQSDFRNRVWACGSCNNILKKDSVFGRPSSLNQRASLVEENGEIKYVFAGVRERRDYLNGVRGWLTQIRDLIDPPV